MVRQETMPDKCGACREGQAAPFPFSMAFQPIVDIQAGEVFAYEALVRGLHGETAHSILAQVTSANRYAFDQSCRRKAITLAKQLGLDKTPARLSINFMPGAVYSPAACIQVTLRTAQEVSFPLDRLIFEITEAENVSDRVHLRSIFEEYRRHGFKMAMDDFGAGYSGLNQFVDLVPDIVKVDSEITRDIHQRPVARATMRALVQLCGSLGIPLVAEGMEVSQELDTLRDCGVRLMQGYLLAKPAFEALPDITFPL